MASQAYNIPDEIIREILPRLPVKTLFRFKGVCKLWHSVISDPNFKLSTQNRRRAIAISCNDDYPTLYHSINDDLSVETLYPNPSTYYDSIKHYSSRRIRFFLPPVRRILGSCNGLILISFGWDILLWNPSTRYCQKVLELDVLGYRHCLFASGLCYDSSIDDYKAVVILLGDQQIANVACLKTKKWRRIEFPYDSCRRGGPVVNERLHWSVIEKEGSCTANKIAYFDSSANKFEMLPMPERMCKEIKHSMFVLGVLDDCLCMTLSRFHGYFEVVVMKQYGEKQSWTSMFGICETRGSLALPEPFFFTKSRKAFLSTSSRGIFTYNLEKKMCNKIHMGIPFLFADTYVDSLVSPFEYYWNDEEHKGLGSLEGLDFAAIPFLYNYRPWNM